MKKYLVYNSSGERIKEIELNSKIFGIEIKNSVVHQVAVAQMANSRVAIAHTKDRSEVRGGGVKPWKQKGTGRARHGSTRSPIWVGGGVTFGPTKDRNFSKKVNKKQKTKALFMCLSDKANNDLFILLDELNLENGKTQELIGVIKNLANVLKLKEIKKSKNFDIKKYKLSLLVILEKSNKNIFNAGRNLQGIKITTADSLNVLDLLKFEKVLIAEKSLKVIEKVYLK
ncbi:50S ribosomal protein L4 [Patescibacteria group bacterium]|nr:50S ribosomal protein L4 [Patescibacteria group bacterium]